MLRTARRSVQVLGLPALLDAASVLCGWTVPSPLAVTDLRPVTTAADCIPHVRISGAAARSRLAAGGGGRSFAARAHEAPEAAGLDPRSDDGKTEAGKDDNPPRTSGGLHASERPGEAAKFAALAADWWDSRGAMAPLHAMNPLRARFVRDAICRCYQLETQAVRPLDGLRVLDVGCGGGLLSESLARMGAVVIGIDLAQKSVDVATQHATGDPSISGRLTYRTASAEQLLAEGQRFDAVTALEVVEHVADQPAFVGSLGGLTQDWGSLLVSTLSRTPQAYALAILGAEYIARLLPRGTHDWSQFVTPEELIIMGRQTGLQLDKVAGMAYNPLTGGWRMTDDTSVNYIASFQKTGAVRDVPA